MGLGAATSVLGSDNQIRRSGQEADDNARLSPLCPKLKFHVKPLPDLLMRHFQGAPSGGCLLY